MRRKAEILQYPANATNTKTNNFTKAEKYSMLVKNQWKPYTQQMLIDISNGAVPCNSEALIQTPTSSSDVPGPIMNLYLDPSIPLYHYTTDTRSYGIINSVDDASWTTYTSPDLLILTTTATPITEFFTLYIHNNITSLYYTYIVETPVSISLTGGPFVFNPMNPVPSTTPITVTIENVYIYGYLNDTLMTSNNPNTNPIIKNVPLVYHDFQPLSLQVNYSTLDFSAVFFTGNLQISNLLLYTTQGLIYDIKLEFTFSITDNNYSQVQLGAFCNVSPYNNAIVNCTLLTMPSSDTNAGFQFGT
jgi:hypothetical protein